MAVETRTQAITRLKREFPTLADYVSDGTIGTREVVLGPAAYDQRIGEWADAQITQQVAGEAEAGRQALAAQLRSFRSEVDAAHTSLSQAVDGSNAVLRLQQSRKILDGVVTRLDQLVDLLIRTGTLG